MTRYSIFRAVLLMATLIAGPAASQSRNVLLLNARDAENRTCINGVGATSCDTIVTEKSFLNWTDGAQLHVVNRKFLTDYTVTVDATFSPVAPPIRGLNEIASLTIGSAAELVVPTKGGVVTLERRSASDFFLDLVDELARDAVREKMVADSTALSRELAALTRSEQLLLSRLMDLVGASNPPAACASTAGAPSLYGVQQCMRAVRAMLAARGVAAAITDENAFRLMNIKMQEAATLFTPMQRRIDVVAPMAALANLEDATLHFELNRLTFFANFASLDAAVALHTLVRDQPSLYSQLRRAQLRAQLMTKLKTGTPPQAAIDDAELNMLISSYLELHARGNPVDTRLILSIDPATLFRSSHVTLDTIRTLVNYGLPALIDGVNIAQSELADSINTIYAQSSVPGPLIKPIDLGDRSGNLLVYFTITRTENFQRYRIVPASLLAIGKVEGAGTPLPSAAAITSTVASTPATVTTTTTTTGATTTTSAAASDSTKAPVSANTASTIVAKGYLEMHSYDGGLVIAAFARGSLVDRTYGVRPPFSLDTAGKITRDTITRKITLTSSSPVNHIMVGVGHYFQKRDTYPGAHNSFWSVTGAMLGLSASKTNTAMVGLFVEPTIGLNLSAGAIYGRQQTLERPLTVDMKVDANTPPLATYSRGALGYFFSAGLDLRIFSKVFGTLTGLGVTAPSTAGTP